jgi:hypothetical protein
VIQSLIGFNAGGIVPVRVGVVMVEVIDHRLGYRSGNLSTTGPVEIRDRETVVNSLQCGELETYVSYVGDWHGLAGGKWLTADG